MKRFLCAITFLTRIPLPVDETIYAPENFKGCIFYFPVVGLLIGAVVGLAWFGLKMIFPATITAALLVLLQTLITGGLHIDGLMDTIDGLGGGRDRESRLIIMKDTHVGAFGVQGAVIFLLLRYAIYTRLNQSLLPVMVLAPVMGRQVQVWLQVLFPYARRQGLGSLFSIYGDYLKLAVTTVTTILIMLIALEYNGLLLFLAGCVFSLLLALSWNRLLGGLTGDTYGAATELTEIFLLLVGYVVLS